MARLDRYPEQLCRGKYTLPGLGAMQPDMFNRWYLLRVLSRQEMALASDLTDRQLAYYLPMLSVRGARKQSLLIPLFSGYMFLYGTTCDRYVSLKTNRIAQIIDCDEQIGLHWDLIRVQLSLEQGEVRITDRIFVGTPCIVREGALMGMLGYVAYETEPGQTWVSMWIKTLGQSILVKLKTCMLDRATNEEIMKNEVRYQDVRREPRSFARKEELVVSGHG